MGITNHLIKIIDDSYAKVKGGGGGRALPPTLARLRSPFYSPPWMPLTCALPPTPY